MLHLSRQRGSLAELLVAYRFLEVGRLVAWPLTPCAYDLVVDGGDRLFRVQVKQATRRDDLPNHWVTRLTKRNVKGDKPVEVTALDVVCIVCQPEVVFVIPVAACASPVDARWLNARISIGPESKYQVFRNKFCLGSGASAEISPVSKDASPAPIPKLRRGDHTAAGPWRAQGQRKPHRRLTTDQIEQLMTMPIRWSRRQSPQGLIPLKEAAQQFDVCPETLKNVVLKGDRLDVIRRASGRGD